MPRHKPQAKGLRMMTITELIADSGLDKSLLSDFAEKLGGSSCGRPDRAVRRHLDWEPVLGQLSNKEQGVLWATAAGYDLSELCFDLGIKPLEGLDALRHIGLVIKAAWGEQTSDEEAALLKWAA
jgi:hypothetical protein